MFYGYALVSTDGQSFDVQVKPLRAAGAVKVMRETASGAKTGRAQLLRVIGPLENGDVLTVTRLARLARSTRDFLNTLATITGKGAGFRSLHDTWADTTAAHGRLMLTELGGLAEFERECVRTGEGRERAKARGVANGVRLGRKSTFPHRQQQEAIKRRNAGKETLSEIARSYNVSRWTIARLVA